MKQLGFAFFQFDEEWGGLPSDETAAEVKGSTGTELKLDGGDVLNQLVASGMAPGSSAGGLEILRAPGGDGGWRYFPGLDMSEDPQTPVPVSPVFDGVCRLLRLDPSVTEFNPDEREALFEACPDSISLAVTDNPGAVD